MVKERISSAEQALRKEEYYELLASSDSTLRDVLNQRGGLVLARVGRYQPWPARFSEPGEFIKMARHRSKKGQACVYFFGSRNYGWVSKSSIQPFPEDTSAFLASNKSNQQQSIQEAVDEAKVVLDLTDENSYRFYDRIMEQRDDAVDMPCELCNRVSDHFSLLILCDGKDCKREYHMNCLSPPLQSVPPGEWICPECVRENVERQQRALPGQESATEGEPVQPKKRGRKPKSRDGIVKRRLSSTSPERSGGLPATKKHRSRRSSSREVSPTRKRDSTTPKGSDGANGKKPPHIKIPRKRAQLLSDGESGTADEGPQSEENCLLCGFGGELIICEFPACTKVYHKFCLGAYPYPKDEDATWYCPRHTCALTGQKESFDETSSILKHASPRKNNVNNLLWKCSQCPAALTDEVLPQLTQSQMLSKKSRTFLCPHCYLTAPGKVQLAKMLEKIWSTLATNRQGMPFCGPLLCGVEPVDEQSEIAQTGLDLFKVLAKIRRLEYDDSASFSRDIDTVVANALEVIANRSDPLMEAAKTLKIIRNEQFAIHQQKIHSMDNSIKRLQADQLSGHDDESDKDKKKWPLQWRQECGPLEDKYYPQLEARSLEEWTALVSAAPLYASADEFDDRRGAPGSVSDELSGNDDTPQRHVARSSSPSLTSANESSGPMRSSTAAVPEFPGLTLSEGTDVMVALGELAKNGGNSQKRRFGGEQAKGLDNLDAREFFLSPSISEMQHMFDQQSTLLRGALEAHATLQRSWHINQQDMLSLDARSGFSVGEGRLAAELRLANKNLRQRLRNKDKLVDQLTSDHMALRAEVINLQKELSESKMYSRELEGKIALAKRICEGKEDVGSILQETMPNGGDSAPPDLTADDTLSSS